MEIAAIPPKMPPAMAPAFELCLEGPSGPRIVPGPSSGESIKVRRGCETVTGREETGERIPTTDVIRFVEVPKVLLLECAVSTLSEKKA
jgi:hypothetical protein